MSVFILSGLAILVVNREALREGPWAGRGALRGAGLSHRHGDGPEAAGMPFCIGFAAALLALGGSWKHQVVRLAGGGIGGLIGVRAVQRPLDADMWQI
jgi:hypothetical protein